MVNLKKPQISIASFKEFVQSKELIAVGAAILITPVLLATIQQVISRFPLLRDNLAVGLVLAGFVIFLIAGMFAGGMPKVRALLVGVAAGVLITGIQASSLGQQFFTRLGVRP